MCRTRASVVRACAQLAKPGAWVFFSTINRNAKAFLFAIVGAEHVLRLLPKGTHEYARFIKPSELAEFARRCRVGRGGVQRHGVQPLHTALQPVGQHRCELPRGLQEARMNRRAHAVLFDLDGTLIDSAPDLAAAVNRLRTERQLPEVPYERLRPMVGSGRPRHDRRGLWHCARP